MIKLMLRKGLKGPFRRSVRDKKGDVTEMIEFVSGVPVDCNQKQCEALADDLGNAVAIVTVKKSGKTEIIREDWRSTVEAVADIAEVKLSKGLRLHKFQQEILTAYKNTAAEKKQVKPEAKGVAVSEASGT